jgi:hypothetical protein
MQLKISLEKALNKLTTSVIRINNNPWRGEGYAFHCCHIIILKCHFQQKIWTMKDNKKIYVRRNN